MSLACGGRGPCCHIGYAHRHCEHCDVVIPLQHYHWGYYQQPFWGQTFQTYSGQLANQTLANQLQALASGTEVHNHAG